MPSDAWERKRLFLRHQSFKKATNEVRGRDASLMRLGEQLPTARINAFFSQTSQFALVRAAHDQLVSIPSGDVQRIHAFMHAESTQRAIQSSRDEALAQIQALHPTQTDEFLDYVSQNPNDAQFSQFGVPKLFSKSYREYEKAERRLRDAIKAEEDFSRIEADCIELINGIPDERRREQAIVSQTARAAIADIEFRYNGLQEELRSAQEYYASELQHAEEYQADSVNEDISDESREFCRERAAIMRVSAENEQIRIGEIEQEIQEFGSLSRRIREDWNQAAHEVSAADSRVDNLEQSYIRRLAEIREERFRNRDSIPKLQQARDASFELAGNMYAAVKADKIPGAQKSEALVNALGELKAADAFAQDFNSHTEHVDVIEELRVRDTRHLEEAVAKQQQAKAWLEDLGEEGIAAKDRDTVPTPYSFSGFRLWFQKFWNGIFNGGKRTDEELQAFRAGDDMETGLPLQPREPVAPAQQAGAQQVNIPQVEVQPAGAVAGVLDAVQNQIQVIAGAGQVADVGLPAHAEDVPAGAVALVGELGDAVDDAELLPVDADLDPALRPAATSNVAA